MGTRVLRYVLMLFLFYVIGTGCGPALYVKQGEGFTKPDANFQDVFYDPQGHVGDEIIWGGQILNFKYVPNGVELTIRQVPLTPKGQPWRTEYTSGNFIIRVGQMLDPSKYKIREFLVVKGYVAGAETKPIGEETRNNSYTYPLITPEELHFWNVESKGTLFHCWQGMGWQGPYGWHCDDPDTTIIW